MINELNALLVGLILICLMYIFFAIEVNKIEEVKNA